MPVWRQVTFRPAVVIPDSAPDVPEPAPAVQEEMDVQALPEVAPSGPTTASPMAEPPMESLTAMTLDLQIHAPLHDKLNLADPTDVN